jgi:hypothetical protein
LNPAGNLPLSTQNLYPKRKGSTRTQVRGPRNEDRDKIHFLDPRASILYFWHSGQ